MSSAYDNYNYPSYWESRKYEHSSEVLAINTLLELIPSIRTLVDVGGGFGRLTPNYLHRVKKAILTDPSAKHLKIARSTLRDKKVKYIQTKLSNLNNKIKSGSVDVALMVRVLHHINDIDAAFSVVHKLLKKGGYFILEFPNKNHFKTSFRHILMGDLTYALEIFPTDLRSKRNIKNTLPFKNYHPDQIEHSLRNAGFELVEKLSVSNIRSDRAKRWFPIDFLMEIEKKLQKPFAKVCFGPSLFLLAKKR